MIYSSVYAIVNRSESYSTPLFLKTKVGRTCRYALAQSESGTIVALFIDLPLALYIKKYIPYRTQYMLKKYMLNIDTNLENLY